MPKIDPPPVREGAFFLFDGSALAYRGHFAFAKSNLSTSAGVPTGATFGFATDLHRVLERVRPKFVVTVFDTPEPTFRHAWYAPYKATRQKMPDELLQQLPWIERAAAALGSTVLKRPGFEADDVIGTLARRAVAVGIPTYIVTGDKDFLQLVDGDLQIYNSFKKDEDVALLGPDQVQERFGIAPHQVVDLLALMGDASDNVPGVRGIGAKTATTLIREYGSVDRVLAAVHAMKPGRVRTALELHGDDARLSLRLVTIDTAVPLDVSMESLAYVGPRREEARALFRELGFKTLYNTMADATDAAPLDPSVRRYATIRDRSEFDALLERLEAAEIVACDTETTGLDPTRAQLVGLSFATDVGAASYIPLNLHPPILPDPPNTERGEAVLERLRSFLESASVRKCGQNSKYDQLMLRRRGIRMRGLAMDTLVASFLIEPEERERSLEALARRHFDLPKIPTEALIGRGAKQITMDLVPIEQVSEYACEDADYTLRLAHHFAPMLTERGLDRLHVEVELPLIEVLADLQETGIRVDRQRLLDLEVRLRDAARSLESEIHTLAGRAFNVNSPKQLAEVLFDDLSLAEKLGVRVPRTKTGWSTDQDVLESLSEHPLPAKILEYRSVTKLLGTYVETLPEMINPETGRIHTTFHQTGAATGRLSSTDPNLQNIPIRSDLGRPIRAAFSARDDDHRLVSADYSQIELRILAHLSNDSALIEAFARGSDIHRDTAARVFRVDPSAVDGTLRSRAKAINFGVIYGMGAVRLARQTELTIAEAKQFIERYFESFPGVRAYLDRQKALAAELGYVTTLMGRRRPIPDIRSANGRLRSQAENMAVNTPIQGTAADFIKLAMVRIHRRLTGEGFLGRMVLTVHDELVFDVPVDEVARLVPMVRTEMSHVHELAVPLTVDIGVGRDWLEAH